VVHDASALDRQVRYLVGKARGLNALDPVVDHAQCRAKEDAMYLTVGVVFVIALVLLSPAIWIAWWLLAELGSRATGSHADRRETAGRGYWRAV
jgi:hypothetical protein